MIKENIFLDNEIDEVLKELAVSAGYDIKADLLIRDIYLDLPENRWKNDIDLSPQIIQYVNSNRSSKEEEVRNNFKKLLIWMRDHEEKAKEIFPDLYKTYELKVLNKKNNPFVWIYGIFKLQHLRKI